jgi:BMFP domain-containing protein YqiC
VSAPGQRLARIHRIRQIEEDQARHAVESVVGALRSIEAGVEQAIRDESEARSRRNHALGDFGEKPDGWIGAEREAQIHRVVAVRNALKIPEIEREIQAKRELYLGCRRERQKLETLLAGALKKQRIEIERKLRAQIDDLFQLRRRRALGSEEDER